MKLLHFLFLVVVAAGISVPAALGLPLLTTELDRGIALANVAATTQSVFYSQAEQVYVQVKTVLPCVTGLSRGQHAALKAKVTDLRMAIELVPGALDHAGAGPDRR